MSEREWTDQQLDDALAALHGDVGGSGERERVRARAALLTAIAEPAADGGAADGLAVPIRRRAGRVDGPTRWVAAAAAVAALVGGGLVVQASGAAAPGASAQAVELLTRSADVISVQGDVPVGPGQFRVVRTHAWKTVQATAVDGSEHRYLYEEVATQWVPFDPSDEWQLTSVHTGNLRWITDERAGRAAGVDDWRGDTGQAGAPETEVLRAAHGEYYGPPPPPENQNPWPATPEFIAGLPRDPDALYDRMIEGIEWYAPSNRRGDADLVAFPADLLRSGLVPADLRAAFYELLTRVPGLRVTDERADLDGRIGVAFGLTDPTGQTQEIIVDPATGEFLGERVINPDGTLLTYSAVTVGVTDQLGAEPAG